jgi:hypothetical protein
VLISKIKQKGGANEVNPLKALNKSIKKFKIERVDYENAHLIYSGRRSKYPEPHGFSGHCRHSVLTTTLLREVFFMSFLKKRNPRQYYSYLHLSQSKKDTYF